MKIEVSHDTMGDNNYAQLILVAESFDDYREIERIYNDLLNTSDVPPSIWLKQESRTLQIDVFCTNNYNRVPLGYEWK